MVERMNEQTKCSLRLSVLKQRNQRWKRNHLARFRKTEDQQSSTMFKSKTIKYANYMRNMDHFALRVTMNVADNECETAKCFSLCVSHGVCADVLFYSIPWLGCCNWSMLTQLMTLETFSF